MHVYRRLFQALNECRTCQSNFATPFRCSLIPRCQIINFIFLCEERSYPTSRFLNIARFLSFSSVLSRPSVRPLVHSFIHLCTCFPGTFSCVQTGTSKLREVRSQTWVAKIPLGMLRCASSRTNSKDIAITCLICPLPFHFNKHTQVNYCLHSTFW